MKSISSNETETDLHDSSDTDIKYEQTNTDEINKMVAKSRSKRVSGVWSLADDTKRTYRRTISDRLDSTYEKGLTFFKKSIDFLRVFIYNLYCKHKHHERINTVKTKDNTKSTKNTKSNDKPRLVVDWGAVGRGIIGLGRLLAVASMIFSAIVIYMGTGTDIVPKVLIVPMAIFALYILVKQFTASQKGDK